jgi:Leucine-rich repeat (LRR) protein
LHNIRTVTRDTDHPKCASMCNCNWKSEAHCTGHGTQLTYIPILYKFIKELNFDRNYLSQIYKFTFYNITHLNVRKLSLAYNGIGYITNDAFSDLRHLKTLCLSGNRIPPDMLHHGLHGLQNSHDMYQLELRDMDLDRLLPEMFSCLEKCSLNTIKMGNNKLAVFNVTLFAKLKTLEFLHLSGNHIRIIQNLTPLARLQRLRLHRNILHRLPSFCSSNHSNSSYFPSLEDLDLSDTLLNDRRFTPQTLACLHVVRHPRMRQDTQSNTLLVYI